MRHSEYIRVCKRSRRANCARRKKNDIGRVTPVLKSPTKITGAAEEEKTAGSSSKFPRPSNSALKRSIKDEFSDDGDYTSNEEGSSSKKKKYYFVRNGDRPSELYRTDLIHKMKEEEDSDCSSDEEATCVRMTDRWREEWNHGVQVPMHKKLPEFITFDTPCSSSTLPQKRKASKFKMPDRLISVHSRRYVRDQHVRVTRPPIRHYQCDRFDRCYLAVLNEQRIHMGLCSISEAVFGDIIDDFEVVCYQGIHRDLLAPLSDNFFKAEFDDNVCCDICHLPDSEDDDAIIFCDGCNVCVHLSCYGLDSVPRDDWLCMSCTLLGFNVRPRCVLCPVVGGAMKCTKTGDAWAHVCCALWIPEVRFLDADHREPIDNICDIPNQRWMLRCCICDTKQGACIQCSMKSCVTAFHASCAIRSGLTVRVEHDANEEDGVRLLSLCDKHSLENNQCNGSPLRQRDETRLSARAGRSDLRKMEETFYLFVSPSETSRRLNVAEEVVLDVYEYWKLRRAENGNRMMLTDTADLSSDSEGGNSPVVSLMSMKMGHVQMLRQNLERARNLTYMVERREKLKTKVLKGWRESYEKLREAILESELPISGRVADRLINALATPYAFTGDDSGLGSGLPSASHSLPLTNSDERSPDTGSLGNRVVSQSTSNGTRKGVQKHRIRERNGPDPPRRSVPHRIASLKTCVGENDLMKSFRSVA